MKEFSVGPADEIPPGRRKLVVLEGREIGVFNIDGRFIAVLNVCPHQGAPVCRGVLGGTTLPSPAGVYEWGAEGRILRCPWHGWEFEMESGRTLFESKLQLKTFAVEIREAELFVRIPPH
jgi:nitrite reductase (NADH) small subunit